MPGHALDGEKPPLHAKIPMGIACRRGDGPVETSGTSSGCAPSRNAREALAVGGSGLARSWTHRW